jgi:Family of unknown function (DUF6193)
VGYHYADDPRAAIAALRRGDTLIVSHAPSADKVKKAIELEFSAERLDWDRVDDICNLVRLIGSVATSSVGLDEWWSNYLAYFEGGGDWVLEGLAPVVRLAHDDPVLRGLAPYQSMARLCFGEQEGGPEDDWPCIEVDHDGRYFIFDRTYPSGAEAVLLAETTSAEEGLRTLKQHLPVD